MQGSTWDSGGKEIFHLPLSQLNKISIRLDGLSSTLEALVFCGDISPLTSRSVLKTCDTNSPLWVRELDSHGEPPEVL